MRASELEAMGYEVNEYNEFVNDLYIINILDDEHISIMSAPLNQDYIIIPMIKCRTIGNYKRIMKLLNREDDIYL